MAEHYPGPEDSKGIKRDGFTMELRVSSAHYLVENILKLVLKNTKSDPLPMWEPGAHLDICLPSGNVRSYSLCNDPNPDTYEIAVLMEPSGRGASKEIHSQQLVGRMLSAKPPRNDFKLVTASTYLFIAGGIGITPLIPMMRRLARLNATWSLHYLGRSRALLPFLTEVDGFGALAPERIKLIVKDEGKRLSLSQAMGGVEPGCAVYCCGPERLMNEAEAIHASSDRSYTLHVEHFGRRERVAAVPETHARPGLKDRIDIDTDSPCDPDGRFEVELRKSGATFAVEPGETILGKARQFRNGLTYSCSEGYCGTCETRVIAGLPDHRDEVLSDDEKADNKTMMICIGRSRTKKIVLDL